MNVLIFDIETIPDVASARKIQDFQSLNDDDIANALFLQKRIKSGNSFLPHYLQKILVISLVLFKNNTISIWSLGDPHTDEKTILQRFFAGLDKHTPTLVSWNGAGFDLPVLHYRALLHGVPAPTYWENGETQSNFRYNNYLNRYHYRHIDLMDVLAGYQARSSAPLEDIALMLGFPGKMGMKGDKVWPAYQNGDYQLISDYCETDVLNTFCVFLRFELMRGNLSQKDYEGVLEKLKVTLAQSPEKTHWQAFAENLGS